MSISTRNDIFRNSFTHHWPNRFRLVPMGNCRTGIFLCSKVLIRSSFDVFSHIRYTVYTAVELETIFFGISELYIMNIIINASFTFPIVICVIEYYWVRITIVCIDQQILSCVFIFEYISPTQYSILNTDTFHFCKPFFNYITAHIIPGQL